MELLLDQSSNLGIEVIRNTVNSTADTSSAVNAASLINLLPRADVNLARQGPNVYFLYSSLVSDNEGRSF
jgi:hypothetical protein